MTRSDRRAYNREYRQRPHAREAERARNRAQSRSPLGLYYKAKSRALRFNLPFNITFEELRWPKKCPLCRNALKHGTIHAPSFDRVNNKRGYVHGNVRIICRLCNIRKGALTLSLARRIVRYMEGAL